VNIAIAGLGAIGSIVLERLEQGDVPAARVTAVSSRTRHALPTRSDGTAPVHVSLAELAGHADVVLEALPRAVFDDVAVPTLRRGKTLLVLTVGGLVGSIDYVALARECGGRILVPSGAMIGLDALRAVSEGTVHAVTVVARKPPSGLLGAPYLVKHSIDIGRLTEPRLLFDGNVRDGIAGFPANVNVAVAVALAGIGLDRTRLAVWADPALQQNVHELMVAADSATFSATISGVASANPRSSVMTALSAINAIRNLDASLVVGG
jgi:aspartate dehydrogenase